MVTFTSSDDVREASFQGVKLGAARFVNSDLTGARFVGCDLPGVVMRAVDVEGMEIDAPWLLEGEGHLIVNSVDVAPLVEAELNRRFPGRAERRATDPEGLRRAWAALERTWAATLERVAAMPEGTVDVSVAGEWSFAQTLRHLVHATDVWLRRAVQRIEQPFHPLGQVDSASAGEDPDVPEPVAAPPYAEVLTVRAERVAMVRDCLATVTAEELAETRPNPHAAQYTETVLSCLRTIIEEEWEHHRFAVRDLDAIASGAADARGQ